MLIDTDVLIWYMRGNENAFEIIENQNGFFMSVITYMELVQGMRNKIELNTLRCSMRDWSAKMLYIDENISTKAMFYVEQHYLSHTLQIADALIGATAVVNGLALLTGNDKHYKILRELEIIKFKT